MGVVVGDIPVEEIAEVDEASHNLSGFSGDNTGVESAAENSQPLFITVE